MSSRQTEIVFRRRPGQRGGRRKGAGRKPVHFLRPGVPLHRRVRRRPAVSSRTPLHVVLRTTREVGQLRRRLAYAAVRRAILVAAALGAIRVVHLSIQRSHLHLIVEATSKQALARGLQSLQISAARHLNRAIAVERKLPRARRGQVFVTRYHAEPIDSCRRARSAIAYVLNNWRRHREDLAGARQRAAAVDPYSSGIHFDGWRGRTAPFAAPPGYLPLPTSPPRSWLLTTGWRKHRLIDPFEVPAQR